MQFLALACMLSSPPDGLLGYPKWFAGETETALLGRVAWICPRERARADGVYRPRGSMYDRPLQSLFRPLPFCDEGPADPRLAGPVWGSYLDRDFLEQMYGKSAGEVLWYFGHPRQIVPREDGEQWRYSLILPAGLPYACPSAGLFVNFREGRAVWYGVLPRNALAPPSAFDCD